MKKLFLILPFIFTLIGCKEKAEPTIITHEDEIVNKLTEQTLDNLATWWWDVPQMKYVYFFELKEYGKTEVDKTTYNKYKIGDIYTWKERIYN